MISDYGRDRYRVFTSRLKSACGFEEKLDVIKNEINYRRIEAFKDKLAENNRSFVWFFNENIDSLGLDYDDFLRQINQDGALVIGGPVERAIDLFMKE